MECSICLSVITHGPHGPCETSCGHVFHKDCITEWYSKGTRSCPMCRTYQKPKIQNLYDILQKKGTNVRDALASLGTNWDELLE